MPGKQSFPLTFCFLLSTNEPHCNILSPQNFIYGCGKGNEAAAPEGLAGRWLSLAGARLALHSATDPVGKSLQGAELASASPFGQGPESQPHRW